MSKQSKQSKPAAANANSTAAVATPAKKSRAAELAFVSNPETSGLKAGFVAPSRAALARQLQPNTSVVIATGSLDGSKIRLSRGKGETVIASPLNLDADGNEVKKARKTTARTVYRVADSLDSGIEAGQLFNSIRGIVSAMAINSSVGVEDANTGDKQTVKRATTTFRVEA